MWAGEVLALLVVDSATRDPLAGDLAVRIWFVALPLAGSEPFIENLLVAIAPVAAREARPRVVLGLWLGALVAEEAGLVTMGVVVACRWHHGRVDLGSRCGVGRWSAGWVWAWPRWARPPSSPGGRRAPAEGDQARFEDLG